MKKCMAVLILENIVKPWNPAQAVDPFTDMEFEKFLRMCFKYTPNTKFVRIA